MNIWMSSSPVEALRWRPACLAAISRRFASSCALALAPWAPSLAGPPAPPEAGVLALAGDPWEGRVVLVRAVEGWVLASEAEAGAE